MSVRELYKIVIWKCHLHSYNRNSKLHFTIETVVDCRKYYLHNCKRDSHLHKYKKNCQPHIWPRKCHLHKCCRNFQLNNCNRNIHMHDCNRKTTNIIVTESTTCKVAIEPQNLQNSNGPCHLRKYSTLDPLGV